MKTNIYKWIVFTYRCIENTPYILLLSGNNKDFAPLDFEYSKDSSIKIKEKVLEEFCLEEKDFYKDRLVDSFNKMSFERDKQIIQTSIGVARIKENINVESKNYPYVKWVKKDEVLNELKTKEHIRSFKRIFDGDSFWECLDTDK